MAKTKINFITVVSGLPRSGTSMIMRMLESGGMPVLTDNMRKADADNPNGYYEFEPVKRLSSDTSWLATAQNKAVKIVYLLLYELPKDYDYRVIFLKRNLEEILASQKVMLQRQGKGSGVSDDEEMARLFSEHLRKFDSWVRQQDNFGVLYLSYNDIVRDTESSVREIKSFLDHRVDADRMVSVMTPTLYRQRCQQIV